MKNNWFEVSKEGLRQLQEGKPKDFVLKELVQNAWDEDGVTYCNVTMQQSNGELTICVSDDAPEGFKDLTHAFTLFAPTYKRLDPEKRGRFNIGEKQVLAICRAAMISTTKGTIIFTSEGRRHGRSKRSHGSMITVALKANKQEFQNMMEKIYTYLPPQGISFQINSQTIPYKEPYKIVENILPTEVQREDRFIKTIRKTKINIHKAFDKSHLYEMGLPICEIDCPYSVDVQQKVPLSVDRETVSQSYLQKVFTIILNEVHKEISQQGVSDVWVREGMSGKEVSTDAVRSVIKARYGDKVVVATPGDALGKDKAIASGYQVIHGREMSPAEWENIRRAEAISSTAQKFPTEFEYAESVEPDENMKRVARLAKRIAQLCFDKDISVEFCKWPGTVAAQYGHGRLTFNVRQLGKRFFECPFSADVFGLLVHELGHEKGLHTDMSYHQCLTEMAGKLITTALHNPELLTLNFDL